MAYEVETKILDVDQDQVLKALGALGAKKIRDTRLTVDWFRTIGIKEGEDEWFLRIRRTSDGQAEVTWKEKPQQSSLSRTAREIHFRITEPDQLGDLFTSIGLELYAHQEKDRISWTYREWQFDLDKYPGMPAYLEIEGKDDAHIQEAIKMLNLEGHKNTAEGERILIQQNYGLDWYEMRFNG